LEVITLKEISKIAAETVGIKGLHEKVWREVTRIEEIVEIPIREKPRVPGFGSTEGVATSSAEPGVSELRTFGSGTELLTGFEDEFAAVVEGERAFRPWSTVGALKALGRRLELELAYGRLMVGFAIGRRGEPVFRGRRELSVRRRGAVFRGRLEMFFGRWFFRRWLFRGGWLSAQAEGALAPKAYRLIVPTVAITTANTAAIVISRIISSNL